MKFLFSLLIIPLAASEIITPASVTLQVGTEFYPAANVRNGSGLSATPTLANYQTVTHAGANSSTAWTTNAPGGGSADYYTFGPAPVFLLQFAETHNFSDLIYWGYHFNTPNGNEGKAFRLEFSENGGATFGASIEVIAPAISRSASTTLDLGGNSSADAIRLTVIDNWFEDFGGGDRVGIGEFRFIGETPLNPAPIIEVNRLLDFGPDSVGATLIVRNDGVVDDLVITPSLQEEGPFSVSPGERTIPAGSALALEVSFSPSRDGCDAGTLQLATNDAKSPMIEITLLAAVNCTFSAPKKADFSAEEGIFSAPFDLALSTTDGATLLYTLDGSIPGEESGFVYRGPITISATTQVRVSSYFPGFPPALRTRSFVKLDPDVAGYSSTLPIVVIENFNGGSIPNKGWSTDTQTGGGLQQVARQSAFFSVFEKGPANTPANFENEPTQSSRIGIRVRGAFSSTWNPKPYAIETWKTDEDNDRSIKILGMASDSDWVLYYPHPGYDRTMLSNSFIWELSRQTGRWAPEFRFVDLFVNEDGGDLTISDRRGVFLLLEKPKRDSKRIEFDGLSADGATGGWLNGINRMDPIPVGGFPAENGATSPQFFHTAGPNRIQATAPNLSGSGDDIPRQYNAFINFEDPNGYRINPDQRFAIESWYREFEDILYDDDLWRDPNLGYRKYLNTTDFIDYMQLLTLAKQGDGLLISLFPWVSSGERQLHMGPMWDFNNGAYSGSATGTLYFRPDRLWYGRLFDYPDFQREYEDRWFQLRAGPLSNANMAAIIDAQSAEITTGLADAQSGLSASSWTGRLNSMKSWLTTRANWIDTNFLAPPSFSATGGIVPADFALTITNTTGQSGTIYYSLDGRDPRDSLRVYNGPVTPNQSSEILARVRTIGGAWSALQSATFVMGTPATAENLIVSEIHYHPTDESPGTEFIELLNISPTETIDLTNASFTAGINFTFLPSTTLAPGERILVVEDAASMITTYGNGLNLAGEFSNLTKLANSGEQIVLTGAEGATIFDLEYHDKDPWPVFADGEGCALTLIQPQSRPDLSLAKNWRCSAIPDGSPGIPDSLIFEGTSEALAKFILGPVEPKLIIEGEESSYQFQVKLGADGFAVTPQSSPDLVLWEALVIPTQPTAIAENGLATYRLVVENSPAKKFIRLLITPRLP